MWFVIVWYLVGNVIAPVQILDAVNEVDCKHTERVINERLITLPQEIRGATCAFAKIPAPV